MYDHAERLADLANANGAKATPEDFMPKPRCKPGQLPASVFHSFAEVFTDGKP